MKMTTKMSAILLGIVLGLDVSILVKNFRVMGAEHMIILFALITIVLDLWEDEWFKQVSRFSSAMIIGIAVREYWQMRMELCFILSVITLINMIAIMAIIPVMKRKELNRESEEEIYDDMSDWPNDEDDYDDEEEDDSGTKAETEVEANDQSNSNPDESEEK